MIGVTVIHCPDCNSLTDWQTGMSWDCDLCGNRGALDLHRLTFPC